MKKIALSIILIVTLFGITSCGKKSQVENNKVESTVSNDAKLNMTNTINGNTTNEVDSPTSVNDKSDVITDINSWNHPVKYVFKNANIDIQKVGFKNDKTYPIFYVSLTKNLDDENKIYYKNLVNQIATANGYWDYEIIDENKNIDIKVVCDRNNRTVTGVTNNGSSNYFTVTDTNDVKNTDDQITEYLKDNVSEVKSFIQALEGNNSGVKAIVYVEREPDPNSNNVYLKNYYGIYVGESHPDHNVNVYRFAINKDTKEILYYDVVNDKYESLSDWRKSK